MPFEIKILDKIHCPRCNGMAELRIDQRKTDNEWVLVYIVCPICRLNRYSYTTTLKATKIHAKIKNLKSKRLTPKRDRLIKKLEELKLQAERKF